MKPLIVVGINDSHDASACVIKNGELVCAISEERLQRVKNRGGFPKRAIEKCLEIAGITIEEVDYVTIGNQQVSCANLHNLITSMNIRDHYTLEEKYWQPVIYDKKDIKLADVFPHHKAKGGNYYPLQNIPFAFNRELNEEAKEMTSIVRREYIETYFNLPSERVIFVDHHLSHAYFGYYTNPLRTQKKDFLVLTADAGGDGTYETVNVFRNGKHECIHRAHDNVIAKMYSSITLLLGMKPHEHEYKVMGLAPYSRGYEKERPFKVFMECLDVEGLKFKRNPEMTDFFKYFQEKLKGCRFDGIAGGVQDFAEELMVKWVSNCIKETGIKDVVISGGLALNIKINKRLAELEMVDSLYIPPGAGDESLSIGSAYVLLDRLKLDQLNYKNIPTLTHAYLGNEASKTEIEQLLNHPLIQERYDIIANASADDIAQLLAAGEICAVFQGRMEFGPRALGHRSILANPSDQQAVAKINEAIKQRDFWMPFTPSILTERISDYVINPKQINCSYMTIGFDTTPLGRKHLAAAIHPFDKTARPQRVEPESNPLYYKIIKAFERKTGIGAVLNTSLNIHGKPIVMKPIEIAEEIISVEDVQLDNIYVEGYLLRKKKFIERAEEVESAGSGVEKWVKEKDIEKGVGTEMYALMQRLFPICRSITGNGVRETLQIIKEHLPTLEVFEVPTGTKVFDWTVPKEWNIKDAYVLNSKGVKVIDFQRSNIHVVSYSIPVHQKMGLEELKKHLHTLPEHPDWIPYSTSYYKEDWGFCLTHRELEALPEDQYEAVIESSLTEGSLTYGEMFLPGKNPEEVLLTCYVCHPSMCNDNLSGVVLLTQLIKELQSRCSNYYSYRFLFIPETIGAITWLARNERNIGKIKHGLVATCVGGPGPVSYKKSRRGDALIDQVAEKILRDSNEPYQILDFFPTGSDERQFCSPGFNLPVGSLMRSHYTSFPQYHTSADDLDFVKPEHLAASLSRYLEVLEVLEHNELYINTNPKGEPQLGRRGLYALRGAQRNTSLSQECFLWILNLSDGEHSLLDIAVRSKRPFNVILEHAEILLEKGLLQKA